jgi:hypothetical protein
VARDLSGPSQGLSDASSVALSAPTAFNYFQSSINNSRDLLGFAKNPVMEL